MAVIAHWVIRQAPYNGEERLVQVRHIRPEDRSARLPGDIEVVPSDTYRGAVRKRDALAWLYREATGHGPSAADYQRAIAALDSPPTGGQ